MNADNRTIPTWILIVSALLALMEIGVSLSLFLAPQSMADSIDLSAQGVVFLMSMWATRQFALGVILAFATFKRSVPMLTLAHLFVAVMFLGDLTVGILQQNDSLIVGGVIMSLIASVILFVINKKE